MKPCDCDHDEILPVVRFSGDFSSIQYWFCFSCGFRTDVFLMFRGAQWTI